MALLSLVPLPPPPALLSWSPLELWWLPLTGTPETLLPTPALRPCLLPPALPELFSTRTVVALPWVVRLRFCLLHLDFQYPAEFKMKIHQKKNFKNLKKLTKKYVDVVTGKLQLIGNYLLHTLGSRSHSQWTGALLLCLLHCCLSCGGSPLAGTPETLPPPSCAA